MAPFILLPGSAGIQSRDHYPPCNWTSISLLRNLSGRAFSSSSTKTLTARVPFSAGQSVFTCKHVRKSSSVLLQRQREDGVDTVASGCCWC